MARDWRKASDYADLQDLDLSGLAWEFLRRNPLYAQAFAGAALGARDASGHDPTWRFGLRFPLDPATPAADAELFWRADLAPAHVVTLAPAPGSDLARGDLLSVATAARQADDGLHLRLRRGLQVLAPRDAGAGDALGALIDLDVSILARLSALRALVRLLGARKSADSLSGQGRRRIVLIVRALDARLAQASYRDIARDVLDAEVGAALDWRLSTARDVAIRLCRSGRRLMGGGYRRLLARR